MRRVLITGGSRGIGRAMVRLFSEKGYSVAFTYNKSEEEARALSAECGALMIKADNASESEIKAAVDKVKRELGGIDILINNAALSSFALFTDISYDEWRRMFSVNLDGAFLYTRELVGSMINNRWGRIINVSSMWGITGSSCEVCYSSTKAALIGMTKSLAKELGPSGITVNCIAPGVIDTDMNLSLSPEDISLLAEDTPLMRIGKADEVARVALFLASEDSSFITGDVVNVSGGYLI